MKFACILLYSLINKFTFDSLHIIYISFIIVMNISEDLLLKDPWASPDPSKKKNNRKKALL